MKTIDDKFAALKLALRDLGSVAVAFSGGVDSTFLLRVAADTLGKDKVLAVIGDSPSLPRREFALAEALAEAFGVEVALTRPAELRNPRYTENSPDRCYFCKQELFTEICRLAAARGFAAVLDGNNADDAGDRRPGRRAAREAGVRSPLLEAGLTKEEVRGLSRRLGLPTAEKPAMACLASRLPYGTPITKEALGRVEAAEDFLHDLGFTQVRVRHHDQVARLELLPAEMTRLLDAATNRRVVEKLRALGYAFVSLDLEGYRTGSMNSLLAAG